MAFPRLEHGNVKASKARITPVLEPFQLFEILIPKQLTDAPSAEYASQPNSGRANRSAPDWTAGGTCDGTPLATNGY